MALGFLDQISPLVGLIAQLKGQRGTQQALTQANVPTQSEIQQNALYQALLDPNNGLMQKLSSQNRAQNLSDFQTQINEMQMADRRNNALGRASTFFNPERADEAVNYLTSRGLPRLNQQSQDQAIQQILAAAGGYQHLQPAQQARLGNQANIDVLNSTYQSQLPTQILDIFKNFGQQQTPMTSGYINKSADDVFGKINWNQ